MGQPLVQCVQAVDEEKNETSPYLLHSACKPTGMHGIPVIGQPKVQCMQAVDEEENKESLRQPRGRLH
eukprot:16795-Pelagomonas_calceolata.AAC.12